MVEMIKTVGTWLLVLAFALSLMVGGWMFDALVKVKLAQWMGVL